MKILYTIYHGFGGGGAEISTHELAKKMLERGHEILIASTGQYSGLNCKKLPSCKKLPVFLQKAILKNKIIKIILDNKIELVHAQDGLTAIPAILAAKNLNVPVVVQFRDYWFACPRSSCVAPNMYQYNICSYKTILKHYPVKRWLIDMYKWKNIKSYWKTIEGANIKIANSDAVKNRLNLCGIKTSVKVIPIFRNIQKRDYDLKAIKKKYGLSNKIILYAGGLTKVKGILNLLDALQSVLIKNKDMQFIIAGDGPLKKQVEEKINKSNVKDRIKLLGWLEKEKVLELYAASDIVVLPSIWDEPLSGIIFEAAHFSKPLVATRTGGTGDIITDYTTGLLVPPKDSTSLQNAIEKLIKDKDFAKMLGSNLNRFVANKLTAELTTNKIDSTYSKLVMS